MSQTTRGHPVRTSTGTTRFHRDAPPRPRRPLKNPLPSPATDPRADRCVANPRHSTTMPAVSRLALGANLGHRLGPGFFNGLLEDAYGCGASHAALSELMERAGPRSPPSPRYAAACLFRHRPERGEVGCVGRLKKRLPIASAHFEGDFFLYFSAGCEEFPNKIKRLTVSVRGLDCDHDAGDSARTGSETPAKREPMVGATT
jgi:hypothetical protein